MTDLETFRRNFPVLERHVYLNAGTEGPMPVAARDAVHAQTQSDLQEGRVGRTYFEHVMALAERLRAGYAELLGAPFENVVLTGSTTDGCNTVLGGLPWQPGDEILTSDQEHPGLLAPLRRLTVRHDVTVRTAPFASLARSITSKTRLIACSHVSWVGGEVADVAGLRATGVPVLLDGAQALGAIPVNVEALGVDYYAAPGQKWLCGPEGSGCLYVRPDRLDELEPPWAGYGTIAHGGGDVLGAPLTPGAKRLDMGFPPAQRSVWAIASLDVLREAGWEWVHSSAVSLAGGLAERLRAAGYEVAPRGESTLVSWRAHRDVDEEVAALAERGIIVRSIPGAGLMRASVGAWCSEADLERLLDAIG